MVTKKTQNSQSNPEKEKGARGIRLPDLRLSNKSTVIKIAWYCHKNRNINPCNTIEKSRDKPKPLLSINL